jgi:division protein CdvB (Snf7/Vps24/ESCRT-III family)
MKSLQEELRDRGFVALSANTEKHNDINIFRLNTGLAEDAPVTRISYSEVLQRNTAQEKLDFILSKLPKDE